MNNVTPVMQDSFGEKGSCVTACLATMLSIPFHEVPRFIDLTEHLANDHDARGKLWSELINKYLLDMGFTMDVYRDGDVANFNEWAKGIDVDYFYIMIGNSPRSDTRMHSVIYKNGEPFHDPNPEGTFLTSEIEVQVLRMMNDES